MRVLTVTSYGAPWVSPGRSARYHRRMARYSRPESLRQALEDRLKARAREASLPLDRLRKEAAFQRLLARIAATAAEGSWALKGGMAMIARVSSRARATADIDATWREDAGRLRLMLDVAAAADLDDYFEFAIGRGLPIQGEGPEGGMRFPVESRLGGRQFETLRFDVNVHPGDVRPVEQVELRNLFDFADLPAVVVPAIPVAQQLAEKLHAYVRDYGSRANSRPKDLYDMLLIAEELRVPPLGELRDVCLQTFGLRATPWPPSLAGPPDSWAAPWAGFVRDYGSRFEDLSSAFTAPEAFWQPLFEDAPLQTLRWGSSVWRWDVTE